jgi:putative RNA 2'-phosphotransferase
MVVKTNEKHRFSFSEDRSLIRANQGHSVKVDLGLEALPPPRFLYHGPAERFDQKGRFD